MITVTATGDSLPEPDGGGLATVDGVRAVQKPADPVPAVKPKPKPYDVIWSNQDAVQMTSRWGAPAESTSCLIEG